MSDKNSTNTGNTNTTGKNNTKNIIDKNIKNTIGVFSIPFIIILIGFIAGGFLPFGSKDVLTASGHEDMIPYIYELWDYIHNGSLFSYSTHLDLGYSVSSIFTYYLSDPTNLLIFLLPKSCILTVINIIYLVKCSLSGLFFFIFISTKNKSKITATALSIAYSLSTYMIFYGMNITWISSVALLPLIILGLEKLRSEKKPLLYIITFTLSFICSFQLSIIIFIFTILYSLVMEHKNVADYIKTFGLKLISDVLTFGLGSIYIYNNLNSSFFSRDYTIYFPLHNTYTNVINALRATLNVPTSNNLYSIHIYTGAFSIFLLVCFALNSRISFWKRFKYIALFLFLITSGFISTCNFLINGMNLSFTSTSVFAFVLIFFSLIICSEILGNLEASSKTHYLVSGIAGIIYSIIILMFSNKDTSVSGYIVSIEFFVILLVVSLSATTIINAVKKEKGIDIEKCVLFSIVILIEVIYSFLSGIIQVGNKTPEYSSTKTYKIEQAISFIRTIQPEARILKYVPYHTDSTPVSNILTGYDFVIFTDNSETADNTLTYVDTINDIAIYYNPYFNHSGIYAKNDIEYWSSDNVYPFSAQNLLMKNSLSADEVFKGTNGTFMPKTNTQNPEVKATLLSYTFPESGDFYVNMSQIIHLGMMEKDETKYINYISSYTDTLNEFISGEFVRFDKEAFDKAIENLSICDKEITLQNNEINVSINAPADGYVILPYNYSDSFISKDGSSEIRKLSYFNDELTMVKVNSGENSIAISFDSFGIFLKGMIISLISAVLLAVLLLLSRKAKAPAEDSSSKKKYNSLEAFLGDNRVFIYTTLILIVIYIIIIMVNRCLPFGNRSALVSDGYLENYPTTMNTIHKFKDWDFTPVSYTIGYMGGSIGYTSFIYFLNPLRLLLFLFPRSMDLLAFNTLYAVEFILTGPSMLLYLTKSPTRRAIDKKELKLIPIALCYSLSSFVICYYHYAGFLELAIIFPIIMLALERMIYEKKYILYVVILSLFMIDSVYFAFLVCEFLFLYFFTLDFENFKDFFNKGIRFALSSVMSALMAIFTLLPFYATTQNTNYSSSDVKTASRINIFTQSLISNIKDVSVMHRLSLTNSDFTVANTYCGLLLFLLPAAYIFIKTIKPSLRIRKIILVMLLYFSYGNELMNFILHGFHKQSEVPNRFSLFFIFLLIQILYDIISNYKEAINKKSLIGFIIYSIIIGVVIIYNDVTIGQKLYAASIIFIAIYIGTYLWGYIRNKHYICVKALLLFLSLELAVTTLFNIKYTFGYNGTSEISMEKMRILSDKYHLKDDIVRTEVLETNIDNASCLINTNSVSIFSSTLSTQQTQLSKEWNTYTGTNYISYGTGNPLANIMLNVRYFFKNEYTDEIPAHPYMTDVENMGNITLVEDPFTAGIGLAIPTDIELKDRLEYPNGFEFQNTLVRGLIDKDLYHIIEMTTDENELDDDHSYILMSEIGDDRSCTLQINTAKDVSGELYLFFDNYIYFMGEDIEGEKNTHEVDVYLKPEEAENINDYFKVAVLDPQAHSDLSKYFNEHKLQNLKVYDNVISGNINESVPSTIYYALPAYESWTAYIDGQKAERSFYLGGIGINVPAGSHEVKLVYETTEDPLPYILSLIFIVLFIVIIIYDKKRLKKS